MRDSVRLFIVPRAQAREALEAERRAHAAAVEREREERQARPIGTCIILIIFLINYILRTMIRIIFQ